MAEAGEKRALFPSAVFPSIRSPGAARPSAPCTHLYPPSGAAFRPAVIPSWSGLSSATATETGDDANGSGKKPSRHGQKERGQTRRPSCASFHQKVVVQGVLLQE